MLSWKMPLLCARTSSDHALISFGGISSTPQPPNPPAFATAIESDGALAPAIGARRMGTRRPKREQKLSTRSSVALIVALPSQANGLYARNKPHGNGTQIEQTERRGPLRRGH